MKEYIRKRELSYLKDFVQEPRSGLMYVRGRRRVGKSWLLSAFQKQTTNCFMFTGFPDSTNTTVIVSFIEQWESFTKTEHLSKLRSQYQTWDAIFKTIHEHVLQNQKRLTLVFDEIQWIAKERSGFCGKLKAAWIEWEKSKKIKVIICGSSNKFFSKMTGGEEKILRGLQTRAHLIVRPLSLTDVYHHCCPKWKLEEVCLLYMMIGGVPYYLDQIDFSQGFVHGINDAIFTHKSIFLDEINEMLDLDFNRAGKKTVKKILSKLGQDGTTQERIIQTSKLPKSTVSDVIDKLVEYNIIFEKIPAHKQLSGNNTGIRYYLKDFYLNFYFQVLNKIKQQIRRNTNNNIFSTSVLESNKSYYIPNFSGKAFELLIRYILENSLTLKEAIFNKILLKDPNFKVRDYWDHKTQIDLIVEHNDDRISRVIECKWALSKTDGIKELVSKNYPTPSQSSIMLVLVTSEKIGPKLKAKAECLDIKIITLKDIIENI